VTHTAQHPQRIQTDWRLRTRKLSLGERTLVMGVVNITTDSFSDGGLYLEPERAVEHALRLLDEGADLIDLGAESTRPGSHAGEVDSAAVSADEEQARLLPVLEAVLKARPETIASVDTYRAGTARAAVAAGAEIVNDVSGFTWDPAMAAACAELGCGLVLMHTRGKPDEWGAQPVLTGEAMLPLVRDGLAASLKAALDAGIPADGVVLDPGYGFGKRFEENYGLLASMNTVSTPSPKSPAPIPPSRIRSSWSEAISIAGSPAPAPPTTAQAQSSPWKSSAF